MNVENMVFHLCEDIDTPERCETVVFAVRKGDQIKPDFHDMSIGEDRQLSQKRFIMRVK